MAGRGKRKAKAPAQDQQLFICFTVLAFLKQVTRLAKRARSDDEEAKEESNHQAESSVPEQVKEELKRLYSLRMPPDFYHFWEFCSRLQPDNPQVALQETVGVRLVGPFDVVCGKHTRVSSAPNLHLHWRHYYDPPEFQTLLQGDTATHLHLGYYRDSPDALPVFVGQNETKKGCSITQMGENLFAAVLLLIGRRKRERSGQSNKALEKLEVELRKEAERLGLPLEQKTKAMKQREKKEMMTFVQFANDECDYGMGLELGIDLFCYGSHKEVAKLLVKQGADVNSQSQVSHAVISHMTWNGFTPLYMAAQENHLEVSGFTPLHIAAHYGNVNVSTLLLNRGAAVDFTARNGITPLHVASKRGNTNMVSLLLDRGAQIDAKTRSGLTPIHVAAFMGHLNIVLLLLQNGASPDVCNVKGFTPLHVAAKYGSLEVTKLLLQRRALPDEAGKDGLTPLHVAVHYNNQEVALLLLEKGASPHSTAKNGYTPLHIAARKNELQVAKVLLQKGADPGAATRQFMTPLHLAAQEGHDHMTTLLLDHAANVNAVAKNSLTPLHLAAQDDKLGYTPLIIACHYGNVKMVNFLLQHGANINTKTRNGYTPLHQAAQQGNTHIINLLLHHGAKPNAVTMNGNTALSIAKRLGYISVVDTLKVVTEEVITMTTTVTEKHKLNVPETMTEVLDVSDEEGEDTMTGDGGEYLRVEDLRELGDDSLSGQFLDGMSYFSHNLDRYTHTRTHTHTHTHIHLLYVSSLSRENDSYRLSWGAEHLDNVVLTNTLLQSGFLVSFMVDARGGAMRGCRHNGLRIIVPPRKCSAPTRVTCRLVKRHRVATMPVMEGDGITGRIIELGPTGSPFLGKLHLPTAPPPLNEGESLVSRILQLGPPGTKFLGPVIVEIPHFAALRGSERELVVLRSETGESWREHHCEHTEEELNQILNGMDEELDSPEELEKKRICRIITRDFPQFFAVVSRIRQDSHLIGPEGGVLSSTLVPQATFSPIVTLEPRRRKFHKPITMTIPVPKTSSNQESGGALGETPTLRLLCSITGGTTPAQWEDITGSTPLTFINQCVSFTTNVSARFWLIDCRQSQESVTFCTQLYKEIICVPYMAKFVIFAKTLDAIEARLRCFCMTDDKMDKTLEQQENFTEVARSRDVEVLEGKPIFVDCFGNLVPLTKSGQHHVFSFYAFKENRLALFIKIRDSAQEPCGRLSFTKEPRTYRSLTHKAICNLNITLPVYSKRTCPHVSMYCSCAHHFFNLFCSFFLFCKSEDDDETESTDFSTMQTNLLHDPATLASPDLLSDVSDMKQDLVKISVFLTNELSEPSLEDGFKYYVDEVDDEDDQEPLEMVEKFKEDLEKMGTILGGENYEKEAKKSECSDKGAAEGSQVIEPLLREVRIMRAADSSAAPQRDASEMVSHLISDLESYLQHLPRHPPRIKKPARKKLREREQISCSSEDELERMSSEESLDGDTLLGDSTFEMPPTSPKVVETPIGSIKDRVKALQKKVEEEEKEESLNIREVRIVTAVKSKASLSIKDTEDNYPKSPQSPKSRTERVEHSVSVKELMKAFQTGLDPSKSKAGLFEHKSITRIEITTPVEDSEDTKLISDIQSSAIKPSAVEIEFQSITGDTSHIMNEQYQQSERVINDETISLQEQRTLEEHSVTKTSVDSGRLSRKESEKTQMSASEEPYTAPDLHKIQYDEQEETLSVHEEEVEDEIFTNKDQPRQNVEFTREVSQEIQAGDPIVTVEVWHHEEEQCSSDILLNKSISHDRKTSLEPQISPNRKPSEDFSAVIKEELEESPEYQLFIQAAGPSPVTSYSRTCLIESTSLEMDESYEETAQTSPDKLIISNQKLQLSTELEEQPETKQAMPSTFTGSESPTKTENKEKKQKDPTQGPFSVETKGPVYTELQFMQASSIDLQGQMGKEQDISFHGERYHLSQDICSPEVFTGDTAEEFQKIHSMPSSPHELEAPQPVTKSHLKVNSAELTLDNEEPSSPKSFHSEQLSTNIESSQTELEETSKNDTVELQHVSTEAQPLADKETGSTIESAPSVQTLNNSFEAPVPQETKQMTAHDYVSEVQEMQQITYSTISTFSPDVCDDVQYEISDPESGGKSDSPAETPDKENAFSDSSKEINSTEKTALHQAEDCDVEYETTLEKLSVSVIQTQIQAEQEMSVTLAANSPVHDVQDIHQVSALQENEETRDFYEISSEKTVESEEYHQRLCSVFKISDLQPVFMSAYESAWQVDPQDQSEKPVSLQLSTEELEILAQTEPENSCLQESEVEDQQEFMITMEELPPSESPDQTVHGLQDACKVTPVQEADNEEPSSPESLHSELLSINIETLQTELEETPKNDTVELQHVSTKSQSLADKETGSTIESAPSVQTLNNSLEAPVPQETKQMTAHDYVSEVQEMQQIPYSTISTFSPNVCDDVHYEISDPESGGKSDSPAETPDKENAFSDSSREISSTEKTALHQAEDCDVECNVEQQEFMISMEELPPPESSDQTDQGLQDACKISPVQGADDEEPSSQESLHSELLSTNITKSQTELEETPENDTVALQHVSTEAQPLAYKETGSTIESALSVHTLNNSFEAPVPQETKQMTAYDYVSEVQEMQQITYSTIPTFSPDVCDDIQYEINDPESGCKSDSPAETPDKENAFSDSSKEINSTEKTALHEAEDCDVECNVDQQEFMISMEELPPPESPDQTDQGLQDACKVSPVQEAEEITGIEVHSVETRKTEIFQEIQQTFTRPDNLEDLMPVTMSDPNSVCQGDSLEEEDLSSHKSLDSIEPSPTGDIRCPDSLETSPMDQRPDSKIPELFYHISNNSENSESLHEDTLTGNITLQISDKTINQSESKTPGSHCLSTFLRPHLFPHSLEQGQDTSNDVMYEETEASEMKKFDLTCSVVEDVVMTQEILNQIEDSATLNSDIPETKETYVSSPSPEEIGEDQEISEVKKQFTPEEKMFKMAAKIRVFDEIEKETKSRKVRFDFTSSSQDTYDEMKKKEEEFQSWDGSLLDDEEEDTKQSFESGSYRQFRSRMMTHHKLSYRKSNLNRVLKVKFRP
ncbi:Ankyrin-2 [Bagarius yarrelli]|uniref:Ankyrin-2 n=1 Tax=Bagarius yarrelli TaxID=175774 RepID=A0A556U898_BAGYA|nr:Ankyrin-2 [Bagarius yarrelli]